MHATQSKLTSALLKRVLPHLANLETAQVRALLQVTDRLPPRPTGLLELRLQGEADMIDICVGIERALRHKFLSCIAEQAHTPSLNAFSTAVQGGDPDLASTAGEIGLEFDTNLEAKGNQTPAIFVEWREQKGHQFAMTSLERLISLLAPTETASALIESANLLMSALPTQAAINHVGMMLSRPGSPMRLQLRGMSYSEMRNYLCSLNFQAGPLAGFDQIREITEKHFKSGVLCLDLSPELQPTLGIEFFCSHLAPGQDVGMALDSLAQRGLCLTEKQEAVVNWPGVQQAGELAENAVWDDSPQRTRDDDRLIFTSISRTVNHLKLATDAAGALRAKAYLRYSLQQTHLIRPSPPGSF